MIAALIVLCAALGIGLIIYGLWPEKKCRFYDVDSVGSLVLLKNIYTEQTPRVKHTTLTPGLYTLKEYNQKKEEV